MADRKKVARTFVPPEAHRIANEFRRAANDVRNQGRRLRDVTGTLNSTWEGKSKNHFFDSFQTAPSEAESYAHWLDEQANRIERIKVTIWEWV